MELLNLLFYCFCFYFITTVNFYTKVSCFILFSLLCSCFLNMNNLRDSNNIFSKYLYLILKTSINIKNGLVNFCYYLSEFELIKILIKYVKILDQSYVDGRKYLLLKLTNKLKMPSNNKHLMKTKKKIKKEKKNDEKVFKNTNDMNNFLDKLKKLE